MVKAGNPNGAINEATDPCMTAENIPARTT